jgi:hypothetical protein
MAIEVFDSDILGRSHRAVLIDQTEVATVVFFTGANQVYSSHFKSLAFGVPLQL